VPLREDSGRTVRRTNVSRWTLYSYDDESGDPGEGLSNQAPNDDDDQQSNDSD